MVVGGDLVEGDDAGDAFHVLEVANPAVDALDVLEEQFVLGAAGFELLRGIDDEHLVLPVLRLLLPEDEDASGEAGAVEEVRPEADDGLQQVHAEEFLPNLALLAHAEEGSMREDDGHAPGLRGHGFDHVLHPGEVAALGGRHPGEVAAIRITGPDLVAPFLQREGRIGDDAVEVGEVVAGEESGATQSIATHNLKVRRAVQEEVHARDGGGGQIFLLPVELAPERADIATRLLHMLDGLQQHAAGAAGGVINRLALTGIEDVHHEPHDGARGVELARLLVRGIGELLDQILVSLPEDVRLGNAVPQRQGGEVLDEVAQQLVRQAVLVRPRRIAKDAVKRVRIRLLNPAQGGLQSLPDIHRDLTHILPVAALRHLEAVVLREDRGFFIALKLLQRGGVFFIMHIREPLEEQQREDVGLEVRRIDRPLEKPGGFLKVGFELGERDGGHAGLSLTKQGMMRMAREPGRHVSI